MEEINASVRVVAISFVVLMIIIAIISWRLKKYVKNLNEVQNCLETSNDLMKQCIEDSTAIIKKQDDEIRRLNGEEVTESSNSVAYSDVIRAVENEKVRDSKQNKDGWQIYLVKRSVDAPPLPSIYDLQSAIVIANSPSDAIDILRNEAVFTDDEWWEVVPIYLNDSTRGIVMSRDGVY